MNREFVQEELVYLKALSAEQVDMNRWMSNGWWIAGTPQGLIANHEAYRDCNTAGCCAGHACLVDIEKTKKAIEAMDGIETITFASVAAYLLGLDDNLHIWLFDKDRWPEVYQVISDQDGLIAIFERALEENSFDFLQ